MRNILDAVAVSLMWAALSACADDVVGSPSGGAAMGGLGGAAGGGGMAGMAMAGRPVLDSGSSDSGMTVMDSCYSDTCVPSRLPPQPDLEFLEDMGDGWQRLMEADWQLAPTSEGYRCMTLTIPRDVYISAFAPRSPLGTHHATFGVSTTANGPDEVVACGVGMSGSRRLQGSGAGSEPSVLPSGVAMRLRAGEQAMMNLHLFNVGEEPLEGRSGMWVKTVPADQVEVEAETVLAGPLSLEVPIGRSTQTGTCTLPADATIYALGPHMHQTGVHFRATAVTAQGEVPIFDGDYDFNRQLFHDVDDVELRAGERVNIECTYENNTDRTINWGDSSLAEMCFAGISLYPAIGYGGAPCSN